MDFEKNSKLNLLLEENKWLKEIDPGVVQIIFDSIGDQRNALEICHGNEYSCLFIDSSSDLLEMFISKMEEEIDQIQGTNESNSDTPK